jgi:hypothetical protein
VWRIGDKTLSRRVAPDRDLGLDGVQNEGAMARGKASMTAPDEGLPFAGTAEPGSEHDPEAAEAYAESVGVDPSPEEIDAYLELAGAEPLTDRSDSAQTDGPPREPE